MKWDSLETIVWIDLAINKTTILIDEPRYILRYKTYNSRKLTYSCVTPNITKIVYNKLTLMVIASAIKYFYDITFSQ